MIPAKAFIVSLLVFVTTLFAVYITLSFAFPRQKAPEPVFLRVVGFWDTEVFNVIKKEFQDNHPEVTIEYEKKNPEHYYENLKADLTKETQGPDLFWWHSSWGPVLQSNLSSLPENTMNSKTYEGTFYPITRTDLRLNGTYRGFPLEFDGLALFYNKKIFASRNFVEPPKTWTTLYQDYVPSLTSSNPKQIFTSAIALGSVGNVENFSDIIGLFLLQNGVDFVKDSQWALYRSKAKETNKLAIDAVDFYFSFSKKARTWDNTQPNSIEAFARGRTAMILLPLHKTHQLLAYLRKESLTLDFAVVPTPQLPDSQAITWGSYWALGVSQKSKKQEAAWLLSKYLIEPDSLRKVYQNETQKNDFGRAFPRVEMAKEQTTHPYLAAYLVGATAAKSWYLQDDTFDSSLNDNLITIFKKHLTIVETSGSSESSLKKMTAEIEPLLKKYGVVTTVTAK